MMRMIKPATFAALLLTATIASAETTARGIAKTLNVCLTEQARPLRAQGERPLVWRCLCVTDAERACVKAGLPKNCFADGWVDADHDSWTINVCRRAEGL